MAIPCKFVLLFDDNSDKSFGSQNRFYVPENKIQMAREVSGTIRRIITAVEMLTSN
jgi:hypothetical protein